MLDTGCWILADGYWGAWGGGWSLAGLRAGAWIVDTVYWMRNIGCHVPESSYPLSETSYQLPVTSIQLPASSIQNHLLDIGEL